MPARHRASAVVLHIADTRGAWPHGPSLIQTLDLLELNLPPSKPSSRQDRLVVELEKKVYEDLTITEKAPARDWDADDAKVIRAG